MLQKKYASPRNDAISPECRFVSCVDLAIAGREPGVYVFPGRVVADGLHYFFSGKFPNSSSYHLSLDYKPQGKTKAPDVKTVGEYIEARSYLERYEALGIEPVVG